MPSESKQTAFSPSTFKSFRIASFARQEKMLRGPQHSAFMLVLDPLNTYRIREQMKEDEEKRREANEEDSKVVHFVHRAVHHFCPTVVHDDTKHRHVGLGRSSRCNNDDSNNNIDRTMHLPEERFRIV